LVIQVRYVSPNRGVVDGPQFTCGADQNNRTTDPAANGTADFPTAAQCRHGIVLHRFRNILFKKL
jgi:hypothetical protein